MNITLFIPEGIRLVSLANHTTAKGALLWTCQVCAERDNDHWSSAQSFAGPGDALNLALDEYFRRVEEAKKRKAPFLSDLDLSSLKL